MFNGTLAVGLLGPMTSELSCPVLNPNIVVSREVDANRFRLGRSNAVTADRGAVGVNKSVRAVLLLGLRLSKRCLRFSSEGRSGLRRDRFRALTCPSKSTSPLFRGKLINNCVLNKIVHRRSVLKNMTLI